MYSLIGINGNAFAVLVYVVDAMNECGFFKNEVTEFYENASIKDYNHLLLASIEMLEKCNSIKAKN